MHSGRVLPGRKRESVMKSIVFLILVVGLLAGVAQGYDKPFMQHDKWDAIQDLHFEISTLNLINGLYLSEDQLKGLHALAAQTQAAQDQFITDYAQFQPEMEKAYSQLRREVLSGAGISETTKQKVSELHEKELKLQFEFSVKIGELESQAEKVLSTNQLHVVDGFSPCLLPPQKLAEPTRAGQAKDTDEIKMHLRNLRQLPDEQYAQMREMMLTGHVNKVTPIFGLRSARQKQAEKDRMGNLIDRARAMNESEFENNLEDLTGEVIEPIENLKRTVKSVEPIERKYLGFGKVGKLLLDPRCVTIYEQRLSVVGK